MPALRTLAHNRFSHSFASKLDASDPFWFLKSGLRSNLRVGLGKVPHVRFTCTSWRAASAAGLQTAAACRSPGSGCAPSAIACWSPARWLRTVSPTVGTTAAPRSSSKDSGRAQRTVFASSRLRTDITGCERNDRISLPRAHKGGYITEREIMALGSALEVPCFGVQHCVAAGP